MKLRSTALILTLALITPIALADRGRGGGSSGGGSGGGSGSGSGGGGGGGGSFNGPVLTGTRLVAARAARAIIDAGDAGRRLIKNQADADEAVLNAMRFAGATQAQLDAQLASALTRLNDKATLAASNVAAAITSATAAATAGGATPADMVFVNNAASGATALINTTKLFYTAKLQRHAVALPGAGGTTGGGTTTPPPVDDHGNHPAGHP